MNIARLKDQARKFETKDQLEKAIKNYREIIDELDGTPEMDDELPLLNKVGDLYLKKNDANSAVEMYEKAAEHYKGIGLPNNAIALYNKVLRSSPSRTDAYLRLGELLVGRGFSAEAKKNFVQYFERMEKENRLDNAFTELKKIADHSEENEELRLLLAEHLQASARTDEARDQLKTLYAETVAQGDEAKQRSTLDKMHAIDPDFDPDGTQTTATSKSHRKKTAEIVFLDLESGEEEVLAPIDDEPVADALAGTEHDSANEDHSEVLIDLDDTAVAEGETVVADGVESSDTAATSEEEIPDLELEPMAGSEEEFADGELITPMDLSVDESEPVSPVAEVAPSSGDDLEIDMPDLDLGDVEATATEEPAILDVAGDSAGDIEIGNIELGDSFELESADVLESDDSSELVLDAPPEEVVLDGGSDLVIEMPGGDDLGGILDMPGEVDVELEGGEVELLEPPVEEVARPTLAELEELVNSDPDNREKRHDLAEALVESGDVGRGIEELDRVVSLLADSGDNKRAVQVLDEALRLDTNSTASHRRKVELLANMGDKDELVLGYLAYADALLRGGDMGGARTAYLNVLKHDPANDEAKTALETVVPEATEEVAAAVEGASDFVDLGALILGDDDFEMDTRMTTDSTEPTGDEDADFREMLSEFKKGIEANIEESDSEAHYDLGVAFKEMGLLDEAIAEFQKALRNTDNRLKASEALGTCFFDKGQFPVGSTVLRRAIESDDAGDDTKIGLLYWLGRCEEGQDHAGEALNYYQRVFAIDINFLDVGDRVNNPG